MDKSITARSTYSTISLAEHIKFQTVKDMTINMSCSRHEPPKLSTWFIKAGCHELNLPIDCSIISSGINCSSITFSSTMTGTGTKGGNSASYFKLAKAELKSSNSTDMKMNRSNTTVNFNPNRALMNQVIWPIIGLLSAVAFITTIGWLYIIRKIQGGNLWKSTTVRKVISTHMDDSSTFAPSCPMESEIRDLPMYSNSELLRFLDSPNETRTMAESANIVIQMERLLAMEDDQTSQSHFQ